MNEFMFLLLAAIILVFSVLTVTSRRILRAATYLLFVLIATAGLYVLLNYFFLAAVQILVYAGGVVVLIIFSILLTSHIEQKFEQPSPKKVALSAFASMFGAVICLVAILNHPFAVITSPEADTSVRAIGLSMLNTGNNGYALPFEVISILLLAAMIAAIIIAKKRK
ncbi:MAG: NADH-quinone oxidoreductase subunit J [Bacteroidota bacterium]|nr:NADH-quinone oxidoreductase subunit J [Bacteroidota bacterium]MDP4226236.1 NADH-quinone oxidoreductase subunit J [Bacteroidota bacterium]MDP4272697.1 NADH-quinone oxidoreductase subunit J [Bacteroidota bacterium]